jgi:hypothetical protein
LGEISLGDLAALAGATRNGFGLAALAAVRVATRLATGLPVTTGMAKSFALFAFLASAVAAVFATGLVTALATVFAAADPALRWINVACCLARAMVLTAVRGAALEGDFVAIVKCFFGVVRR